jgi:hypothetical protein
MKPADQGMRRDAANPLNRARDRRSDSPLRNRREPEEHATAPILQITHENVHVENNRRVQPVILLPVSWPASSTTLAASARRMDFI